MAAPLTNPNTIKVFVGNLPFSTTEDSLRELFGADRNVFVPFAGPSPKRGRHARTRTHTVCAVHTGQPPPARQLPDGAGGSCSCSLIRTAEALLAGRLRRGACPLRVVLAPVEPTGHELCAGCGITKQLRGPRTRARCPQRRAQRLGWASLAWRLRLCETKGPGHPSQFGRLLHRGWARDGTGVGHWLHVRRHPRDGLLPSLTPGHDAQIDARKRLY